MTIFQNVRKGLIPARLTVREVYELQDAGLIRDSDNFELIDGEIVPMAAAKANWHSIVEGQLIAALAPVLTRDQLLYPAPSIAFSERTILEPDLVIAPKSLKPRDLRGPDLLLVIEVADSSLPYDLRVKAPLYAAHGVRDYWVVDAVRRTIRVHRDPDGGNYTDVEEYEAHDTVGARFLESVVIRLDMLD